jgi:hypothetical protein
VTVPSWAPPAAGTATPAGPRLLKHDQVAKAAAWVWLTAPRRLAARVPALGGVVGDGHALTAVPLLALALPVACALAGFWVGAQHWGYTFIATESVFLLSAFVALGALSTQLALVTLVSYALGDFFVRLTTWDYTVLTLGGGGPDAAPADDPFGGLVGQGDGLLDSGYLAGLWRVRLPLLILYGVYAVGGLVAPRLARGVAGMVLRATRLPRHLDWLVGSLTYVVVVWLSVSGWLASAPLLIRPVFTWKGGTAGELAPAVVTVPLQHFRREIVAAAVVAAMVRQLALFLCDRSRDARARVDVVGTLAAPTAAPAPVSRGRVWRRILAAAVIGPLMAAGMLEEAWTWGLAVAVALVVAVLRSELLPAAARRAWSATVDRVPVLARVVALVVGVRVVAGVLAESVITSYAALAVFVLSATLVGALLLPPEGGTADRPPAGGGRRAWPPLPAGALVALAGLGALVVLVASADPALADNCSTFSDCFAVAAAMADAAGAASTVVPVVLAAGAAASVAPAPSPGQAAPAAAREGAAAAGEALAAEVLGQAPVAAASPALTPPPSAIPDEVARAMLAVDGQAAGPVHETPAGGTHAEEEVAMRGGIAAATTTALATGAATVDLVVDHLPCPGCSQVLASQLADQRAQLTPEQAARVRFRVQAAGPAADAVTTTRSLQVLLGAGWDVQVVDSGAGPTDAGAWLAGAIDQVRAHLELPPTAPPPVPVPAAAPTAPASASAWAPAPSPAGAPTAWVPGPASAPAPAPTSAPDPAPGPAWASASAPAGAPTTWDSAPARAQPPTRAAEPSPGATQAEAQGQVAASAPAASPPAAVPPPGRAGASDPTWTQAPAAASAVPSTDDQPVAPAAAQAGIPSDGVAALGRAAEVAAEMRDRARVVVEEAAGVAPGSAEAAAVADRAEDVAWRAVYAASEAHQAVVTALGDGSRPAVMVQDLVEAAVAAHQTVEAAGATAPTQAAVAATRSARAAEDACRSALSALGLPADPSLPPPEREPSGPSPAAGPSDQVREAAPTPVADALRGTVAGAPAAAAAAVPPPAWSPGPGGGSSSVGEGAPVGSEASSGAAAAVPPLAAASPPRGAAPSSGAGVPAAAQPPAGAAAAAPPGGVGAGPPLTPPGPPAGAAPAAEPPDDLPQRMERHREVADTAHRQVRGAVTRAALLFSWANLGHTRGTGEARAVAATAERAADRAVAAAEAAGSDLALTGPAPARQDAPDWTAALRLSDVVTLAARLGDLAVEAGREAAAELGLAPAEGAGDDVALVDSQLATRVREAADEAVNSFNRTGRISGTADPAADAASKSWAATAWEAGELLLRRAAVEADRAAATARRVTAAAGSDPSSRAAVLAHRADTAARVVAVLSDNVARHLGGSSAARAAALGAATSAVAAGESVLGADEVARIADDLAAMEPGAGDTAGRAELRVFERNEDAGAYGAQTWAAARARLTPDQSAALAGLTTKHGHQGWPGFVALYATCRGLGAERGVPEAEQAFARESIERIDEAVHLQPVPEDVLVVREVFPDTFDRRISELEGTVQEDLSFLSTALTAGPVYDPTRPVALHLRVPAGTPALYLGDVSEAPGEQELVLGRGVRYRVVAPPRRIGGRWHVYAEVLQEGHR